MIAKALTEVISFNKSREVMCRKDDMLLITDESYVCIDFGWAGYFPIKKENLEFLDMKVKTLIQVIEQTEQNFAKIKRKDVFPVDFVKGILEREGYKEEFLKELSKSKISANLKKKLNEV